MADATPKPSAAGTPTESTAGDNKDVVSAEDEEVDKSVVLFSGQETQSTIPPPEEEEEGFGSKMAYILTLVGYAVGFGNIWRFPYLIQENGGVAFLVPYCLMLTFLGIPTFFLELAIGQRLRKGPVGTWNEISPYLGGIGVMCGCTCFIVGMYYTTLIAWCVEYLIDIFRSTLRWSNCDLAVRGSGLNCSNIAAKFLKEKTRSNLSLQTACDICKDVGPSVYYWNYEVLVVSKGINEPGIFNPYILLYLVISWVTVWAILVKGLTATGKVVYFTALFPYVVLVIFLISGLTLPGMENGFKVLFTPDWSKLLEGKVWMAAGTQIFFSLGLGFGVLIAFASHLPSNNNCYRDAVTVALINCSTSLFASLVVFSILGFQGTKLFNKCVDDRMKEFGDMLLFNSSGLKVARPPNKFTIHTYDCDGNLNTLDHHGIIREYSIDNSTHNGKRQFVELIYQNASYNNFTNCSIVTSLKSMGGTGLVFVVFADAMAQLPAPQFFAFLFYTMLFTLGIDSAFSTVEGAIACLVDLKLGVKKWILTTIICSILLAFSTIFAFGWGQYVLTFMDEFSANWCLLIVAFFECIGIAWVYGLKRFSYDIKLMTGHRPNIFLMICWKIISPLVMLGLMIATLVGYATGGIQYTAWNITKETISGKEKYTGTKDQKYPRYLLAVGFSMLAFAVMWIPLMAFLKLIKKPLLKEEVPAYFPEEELREERNITSDEDEDNNLSTTEKVLFWGSRADIRYRPSQVDIQAELGESAGNIGSAANIGSAGTIGSNASNGLN